MNIKNILSGLLVLVFFFSCNKENVYEPSINADGYLSFNHNGIERQYMLYKPSNLPANPPLVFVLHGLRENARRYYDEIGFNQVADTAKFAVCYPQGINNAWDISDHNTTDVFFLKELAQYLQTQHSLNPEKTYVTGFSMGGAMCNLLALDANDIFKAAAPVAGYCNPNVWSNKNPQNYIPYFTIHGTDDPIVSINGNKGRPGTQAIVDFWMTFNNCTSTDTVQFTTNTTSYYHRNGTDGNEVWYYKIDQQSHIFPGDSNQGVILEDFSGFNGAVEIWNFFRKW